MGSILQGLTEKEKEKAGFESSLCEPGADCPSSVLAILAGVESGFAWGNTGRLEISKISAETFLGVELKRP
jgi:hypothetical protein